MTSRELAAYIIILLLVAAALAGWRLVLRHRRKERRSANQPIHILGNRDRDERRGGPKGEKGPELS